MRVVTVSGLGILALLFAFPAEALTVTNHDPDPVTITVTAGSDSQELTIEPDSSVEPPCDKGCTVELESGEQYEMTGAEEASIENGVMFFDSIPGTEEEDIPDAEAPAPNAPDEPLPSPEGGAEGPPAGEAAPEAKPEAE